MCEKEGTSTRQHVHLKDRALGDGDAWHWEEVSPHILDSSTLWILPMILAFFASPDS